MHRRKAVLLSSVLPFIFAFSVSAQQNPDDKVTPSWNPNGRIYFRYNKTGNGDVYSVKADGSDMKLMIGSPGEDYPPRWSRDGKRGVFMTNRDGGDFEIYSVNADGTEQKRLTFNKGNDWDPAWSPDGKRIVFMSSKDGNWEIYTMNADGND